MSSNNVGHFITSTIITLQHFAWVLKQTKLPEHVTFTQKPLSMYFYLQVLCQAAVSNAVQPSNI